MSDQIMPEIQPFRGLDKRVFTVEKTKTSTVWKSMINFDWFRFDLLAIPWYILEQSMKVT